MSTEAAQRQVAGVGEGVAGAEIDGCTADEGAGFVVQKAVVTIAKPDVAEDHAVIVDTVVARAAASGRRRECRDRAGRWR